jgi:hypothetical protein
MGTVRVRAVTAVPGLGWGQVGDLERDSSIDGAIEDGRLVEVDEAGESTAAQLRGEALTDALKAAGLSTSGSAEEKRARLAEHHTGREPGGGPAPGGFAPGAQTGPGTATGG